ncbi:ROK family protein [Thiorhodovibrio frisius]|uniref:Transcriptional regulator/sugar kinase n=1 Tax=Thiorhodovibrio frisius TaxID=631362 RepID=H8Z5H6_9GAMM|nr:ROK family protein [Thiorhodovibrio frisius]EIC19522.1 transcriptional regulator/sugar kinase [Thiorhodovibrio frisius]WPL20515.1 Fructokinase [Thiorhodovibrio frisius]
MRIGVDLGGTKIEAVVLEASGEMLWRGRQRTPQGDYAGTLATVARLVAEASAAMGPAARGLPVGVGVPGALSPFSGRLRNANSTCLNDRLLDVDLQQALERPVRLANDADCFALSEASDGAGVGAHSVFGVILGTGTGGGIVINGQLLKGPNAIVGEWGHNPLPWPRPDELPGPPCYCGKRGCIETFVSGPGLAADYHRACPRSPADAMSAQAIATAAADGDPAASAALERHRDRLARALASVINLLDPEVIVLGGGLSNLSALYTELPPLINRHAFTEALATRILPPRFGDSSGVRGAAWLWPDG